MAKNEKKLTITLEYLKQPVFKFDGEWVGRDIQLVSRTIIRAYRKQQLAARREANISNPVIGGLPVESSDNPDLTSAKGA